MGSLQNYRQNGQRTTSPCHQASDWDLQRVGTCWSLLKYVEHFRYNYGRRTAKRSDLNLLPILWKLFENLLASKILSFLTSRNIIRDHQFGFRGKHGTIEQVHHIVPAVRQPLKKNIVPPSFYRHLFPRLLTKCVTKGYCTRSEKFYRQICTIMKSYIKNR